MRILTSPFMWVIGLIILLTGANHLAYLDDQLEAKKYCSMVYEFKASGGEYGWPDFKKIYADQCTSEGKLKPV